MEYVTQGMALLSEGFDATNAILGLVLAVLAAWTMRSISQIILISLFTTAIHEMINTGRAIFTGVPDPLPDIFNVEGDLKLIGIRFAGYMATITILYLLKRMVFRG